MANDDELRQLLVETDTALPLEKITTILDAVTEGVVMVGHDGRFTYANPQALAVFGYTPEAVIGKTVWELFPHTASAPFQVGYEPAMATEVADVPEEDAVPALTWLQVRAYPTPDGIGITFRDNGARQHTAATLHFQAQLLDHVGTAVIVTDIAGRITHWNTSATALYGWTAEEALGQSVGALQIADFDDATYAAIWACLRMGKSWTGEFTARRKDGTPFPATVIDSPLRDAAGVLVGILGVSEDITERKAAAARLVYQAHHDLLTGLPNRALLLDYLAAAAASGERYAVVFIDLDHFKDVNRTLGHFVGDRLLMTVGRRLRGALRAGDLLVRLGGDEFVVVLHRVAGVEEATACADRLLQLLATPFPLEGREYRMTASIGIVVADGEMTSPMELLRDADVALFRAKAGGRAHAVLFEPAMQVALTERLALEADIWRGLERGEFVLHYQPIIDLQTGATVEVEALLRWRHPQQGWIAPGVFVPIAEACGAMQPLGRWVLAEACRQGRAWLDRYPGQVPVTIGVNLSAREFQDAGLTDAVTSALRNGFPPELLRLEITESAAMGDATATLVVLRRLRELGVRVALDDFGTGYSSLAHLQRLPVDSLKIDRAFVSDLVDNPRSVAICAAIVALGTTLGLDIVAEGIETEAQGALAAKLGCQRAQGYLYSHPLAAEMLEERLWRYGASENGHADRPHLEAAYPEEARGGERPWTRRTVA